MRREGSKNIGRELKTVLLLCPVVHAKDEIDGEHMTARVCVRARVCHARGGKKESNKTNS